MSYNNKESELNDIIRVLNKKEGAEIHERLAKVVLFLHKELNDAKDNVKKMEQENKNSFLKIANLNSDLSRLKNDIFRLERRTEGMDRAR